MNPYLLFLLLLFIVLHSEMFPPKKFFLNSLSLVPMNVILFRHSLCRCKEKTESGWALDSMTSALRRKELEWRRKGVEEWRQGLWTCEDEAEI